MLSAITANPLSGKVAVVILVSLYLTLVGLAATADERPNIILLMADDQGWDETGYNGHPYVQTPTLDAMAESSLRFDNFYAAHPSCSPTRGSVLTGRHPNRYGVFAPGWSIHPEEITIAQILHNSGYACAHFGKWHLGPVKAASPTNPGAMGFEHWLSHDNFFEMNPVLSRDGGPQQKFVGEGSEVIVAEAIKYISQVEQRGQPFFVVIWYGSPHEPYSGRADDLALYDNLPSKYNDHTVMLTSNDTGLQVKRHLGDVLQERYAEITAMDRSIGQLRDWLASHHLRDSTLLWYCSDNGSYTDGSVTSPFRGHKGTIYEGGVRVPGIIEWPARYSEPRVIKANAVTSDILPTICELLDLSLPDRPMDGESLVPMICDTQAGRDQPICFWDFKPTGNALHGLSSYINPELQSGTTPLVKKQGNRYTRDFKSLRIPSTDERYFDGPRAILDNQYKVVVNGMPGKSSIHVFDLGADPAERRNIAGKMPKINADLQQRLRDWQESVLSSLTGADY